MSDERLPDREMFGSSTEPSEEQIVSFKHAPVEGELSRVKPSQFTRYAFFLPTGRGGTYENFSFGPRRHLRRIYDTPAQRVLLCCGRQTEKSTMLGNIALCYTCLVPAHLTLYVSPSATQTKTFSNDRIKEPIETSRVLRRFTTHMLSQNVFEKQFVNRSKITLRYAFLNADRTRGIPAHRLAIDEFQDILTDNVPVIEQCLSHAPEHLKRYVYAGTPKSLDNPLEQYRSKLSTQGEWVVPCDGCGSNAVGAAGRYWNILGEKNIGRHGLVCERCGRPISAQHADAQWAFAVKYDPVDTPFEGYRISQLMVPWKPWDEVLLQHRTYSRARFYNEVLGLSYDSGLRPLTKVQIQACCNPDVYMSDVAKYRPLSFDQPFFVGIDWGTGENTYTVLTLATYVDMKFRVLYAHRFIGEDIDPEPQMKKIIELVKFFNVRTIGTDYGGGFDRNDTLMRTFGPERVFKFQYAPRPRRKVEWSSKLRRWIVHRTEVMSDVFNAIKRGRDLQFPRWEEFEDPYAQDMLNIFSEHNEQLRMIMYKHGRDMPDDSFHSLLYCLLGSMVVYPRPDLIAARKEDARTGRVIDDWHPVNQG